MDDRVPIPANVYLTRTGIALESGSSLASSDKPYGSEQASCQVLYVRVFFSFCGPSGTQVDSQPMLMFENYSKPSFMISYTVVSTCWYGFSPGHLALYRQSQDAALGRTGQGLLLMDSKHKAVLEDRREFNHIDWCYGVPLAFRVVPAHFVY